MSIRSICRAALVATLLLPPGAMHALTWIESSGGLIPPNMDEGNTELEFADIDLDGHVDLVSVGDHGSPGFNSDQHGIMVWFGDGQGNWTVQQSGQFGYGGLAVGDVNNDGFPDIGYGIHHNYSGVDFGDQLIEVALGDGSGIDWTPWDDGLATAGETWGMFGTDFADIDGDGDLDLASASFGGSNGTHVYRNEGDGTWSPVFGSNGGGSNFYVEFGDLNGDGYPDLASTTAGYAVCINDGTGDFSVLSGGGITPPTWLDIALGDIDEDGIDELAIVTTGNALEVWKLNPDGQTWSDMSANLGAFGGFAQMVDIAEMNGDGHLDLVVYGNATVGILAGDGGASWSLLDSFNTPSPGDAQAFRAGADIDHNGYGDIAVVNQEPHPFFIYRNHTRVYRESSTPDSLTVVAVYPHGGEVVRGGAVGRVEWLSAVPGGTNTKVDIEFSSTGPGGPFDLLAGGLPNNGARQVLWPPGVDSNDCYLRITVHGPGAVSTLTPAPFAVRSSEPAPITIEILPDDPPIVVPPGGSFTFTGILTNRTALSRTADVWIVADVPGLGIYGPVLQYDDISLSPSQVLTVPGMMQEIPSRAPAGTYRYIAQWGLYPYALGTDSFEFTVTP